MSNIENLSRDVDARGSTRDHALHGSYVTSFNSRLFESPPPVSTQFEQMAESLRLEPHEYLHSKSLREWARMNRHDRYVPSELLREWGLD
jgi:hypothetical protein